MKKRIGSYPRVRIEGGGRTVVSQAGGVLLVETVRKAGLDTAISAALTPWRKTRAVHDPGKILLDVALAVALGGDCLADVAMLRAEPAVFGPVASDHISAAQLALAQLPKKYRRGRRTLIRTDSAGGTHDFVAWLAQRGRWLSYSVGMVITEQVHQHVLKVLASAWTAAVEADGAIRDGAWVAELAGDVLDGWPKGMRLIVRKERPHPGAQLRLTDADGMRLTCFATNTLGRPIAELELRHRLRARAEDRIRAARTTGLRNLPLHRTTQNRIWLEIVQIALDLLAWMPMLALTGRARLWEPRRLRLRLFTAAGQLVTTGRRRILRLARHWPWTGHITAALDRLTQLPSPG
ncbi:transposase [Streptomyces sp. NPDC020597]|uniref:transposase n=1 Tax=unclassified Streptomyces TaxID=2593676 RepID=UPI0037AA3D6E